MRLPIGFCASFASSSALGAAYAALDMKAATTAATSGRGKRLHIIAALPALQYERAPIGARRSSPMAFGREAVAAAVVRADDDVGCPLVAAGHAHREHGAVWSAISSRLDRWRHVLLSKHRPLRRRAVQFESPARLRGLHRLGLH